MSFSPTRGKEAASHSNLARHPCSTSSTYLVSESKVHSLERRGFPQQGGRGRKRHDGGEEHADRLLAQHGGHRDREATEEQPWLGGAITVDFLNFCSVEGTFNPLARAVLAARRVRRQWRHGDRRRP
eukprot:764818-Hanusia_phi.AAC.4